MRKEKRPDFSHAKIVLTGLLATKSLIRNTAEIVYRADYNSDDDLQKAVMGYLHSLGMPKKLIFDDVSSLFEVVFPDAEREGDSPFPIDIKYDQDNCQYGDLIAGAVDLDNDGNL